MAIAELFMNLPCDLEPEEKDWPNAKYVDEPCITHFRVELLGFSQRCESSADVRRV